MDATPNNPEHLEARISALRSEIAETEATIASLDTEAALLNRHTALLAEHGKALRAAMDAGLDWRIEGQKIFDLLQRQPQPTATTPDLCHKTT